MRAARQVVAWERARGTRVELTLLDAARMRRLNRRATGRRRITDVIAFALPQPDGTNRRATGRRRITDVIAFALPQPDGTMVGDVYLCPAAARRWVGHGSVTVELVRLAVHGTLHVLGYDHPDGPGRTRSRMWRKQETYVRRLVGDS